MTRFPDPTPETLRRIQAILHRYQVAPSDADEVLERALYDVAWRQHASAALRDVRLVFAVERRARAHRERILRLWLEGPEELPPGELPS